MPRNFTQSEADRHNKLTDRGNELTKALLVTHDSDVSGMPGWFDRRKLRKAVKCYQKALAINPEGWASMWHLGKIYQRLLEHETALEWFSKAFEINPSQPDVAREAGLAALDCGQAELALRFCLAAVKNKPQDPGLVANLALAHMLCGDDTAAVKCARESCERAPNDEISKTVLDFVISVANGEQVRPKNIVEVFPY